MKDPFLPAASGPSVAALMRPGMSQAELHLILTSRRGGFDGPRRDVPARH
jgi:hypothetical protein